MSAGLRDHRPRPSSPRCIPGEAVECRRQLVGAGRPIRSRMLPARRTRRLRPFLPVCQKRRLSRLARRVRPGRHRSVMRPTMGTRTRARTTTRPSRPQQRRRLRRPHRHRPRRLCRSSRRRRPGRQRQPGRRRRLARRARTPPRRLDLLRPQRRSPGRRRCQRQRGLRARTPRTRQLGCLRQHRCPLRRWRLLPSPASIRRWRDAASG